MENKQSNKEINDQINDQIIANQVAGMPLEEAIFQAGYNAGYDNGYERGRREVGPAGAAWVKGVKGFPIRKKVIAKFKHYDDPLRDWIVGGASSSTGEMITFDWHVSSITLDINHERWAMLEWLDESAGEKEVDPLGFAEWAATIAWFDDGTGLWELMVEGEAINGQFRFTTKEFFEIYKKGESGR